MTNTLKKYILALAEKGLRKDGRSLTDYRKDIKIEYNISKNAEGSAAVTIGNTRIVCGVKAEIGKPYPDKPDEGSLIVTAEFSPIASADFEPGPPSEYAIELARVVDRGIRESGAIDTKKLNVETGEKVWLVLIDLYVQNHDGNLIDTAALAAMAALLQAKFPKYDKENDKIDYEEHTDESIPIVHQPLSCTITKIGKFLFVDTTADEEKVSDGRLTIEIDENGIINGMQKGGPEGFTEEEVRKSVDMALEKLKGLRGNLG